MKNSYDEIKTMLNTLRNINTSSKTNRLLEQTENYKTDDDDDENQEDSERSVDVINDVDVNIFSEDENELKLTDEQRKLISELIDNFKINIGQNFMVKFEPGFTIKTNQIRLDGKIDDYDLNFVFIAGKDSGIYINAEMLKLDVNLGNILEKIVKFEKDVFRVSMTQIVNELNNN